MALMKYPPSREFSRRKVAEIADVPQSTANRKLETLAKQGVIDVRPIEGGNTHLVSINEDSPHYGELKSAFEKQRDKELEDEKQKGTDSGQTITLHVLESYLWQAADILRGSIDSSDYKSYIFGLLFLKRLSDRYEEEAEELIEEGIPEKIAFDDEDLHTFYLPPRARWEHVQKQNRDIGATINKAFEEVENRNDTIENGVLTSIDFNDKERLPDPVLEELIVHFSQKSFRNENLADPDIFGRAYEYLIRQFADDAGKKGGEFYTPRGVVQALVKILDPQPGMRVYDPCCGSGGMLIYSASHIREDNGGSMEDISLYGQERNLNTWAIAEMNILLHNLPDARIAKGDTMREPKFLDNAGGLMVFDRVIANPMWNQKRWSKEFIKENQPFNRFPYGLPPKNSADWAWVQHMLASLNQTGKMGVVLDNGVLFRSRSEGKIRRKALEDDLVEAVIALPGNLFYNTSSPGCIMILNKDKPEERRGRVLFIYAEDQEARESGTLLYEELSNQNRLLDSGIEKIVETYQELAEEDHFSRLVGLEEIEENDWNLNVPRYVDTTEPEEPIDVSEKRQELQELEGKRDQINTELNTFLEELGYE
ncbi:MAG: N-6 DNA methylase [Candidatus Brocadiia bacterium]